MRRLFYDLSSFRGLFSYVGNQDMVLDVLDCREKPSASRCCAVGRQPLSRSEVDRFPRPFQPIITDRDHVACSEPRVQSTRAPVRLPANGHLTRTIFGSVNKINRSGGNRTNNVPPNHLFSLSRLIRFLSDTLKPPRTRGGFLSGFG